MTTAVDTTDTVQRKFVYENTQGEYASKRLTVQKYVPVTQVCVFIKEDSQAVTIKDEGQMVQAFNKGYVTGYAEEITRIRNFNDNFNVDFSSVYKDQTCMSPSIDWGIFKDDLRDSAELQLIDDKLFYVLN